MSPTKTHAHAPVRSLDQRMDALKRANDIRVRRAQLKKDLKNGKVKIEAILGDPPEYVSTAKVFDMLMAVPKFGRVKAARFLNHVPDQPVEDGRRAVRPAAGRADRPLRQQVGRTWDAAVLVVTGPVRRRQGDAHPRARRPRARDRGGRLGDDPRPRAGEEDGREY